jgi:hypothetical protein
MLAYRLRASGARYRALGTLALVLALASCAAGGARPEAAWALGSVNVVRVSGGGSGGSADLSALPGHPAPDVAGTVYSNVITAPGGAPTVVTVPSGYSVATLLHALGVSASSFTYAEVIAPDGRTLLLTAAQAAGAGAFPDGPAVVWGDGAGAHFLLPSLPGGGLAYAGATFAAPAVTIELHSGTLLAVGISSSTTNAVINKPVTFNSSVGGAAGGLSYQWSFGDGVSGGGASVTHIYTTPGTYDVTLQVSGPLDSLGVAIPVAIVVGNPPPGPPRAGRGTGAGGLGSGTGSGTGTGSGAGPGTGAGVTVPAVPPTPSPPRHRVVVKKPPPPKGPLVSGILVADTIQATGTANQAAGGSRAARAARAAAAAIAEWFWILLVTLLVVLLGGLMEWAGTARITTILGITSGRGGVFR